MRGEREVKGKVDEAIKMSESDYTDYGDNNVEQNPLSLLSP